jgi:hypothetical protein
MAYAQQGSTRQQNGDTVRVQFAGDQLGILPVVAAAVPSVSQILGKIGSSVIAIFDPGKKRDADREARAEMYYQLALQGSTTAANRMYSAAVGIHGGVGPTKEANFYKERWAKFQAQMPDLAATIPSLPRVGLPDPQAPTLQPADQQAIQAEITAFHTGGATPQQKQVATKALADLSGGIMGNPLVLGAALIFAVVSHVNKPTRRR